MSVSIHTPAWGVTYPRAINSVHNNGFNPHSRVGSDGVRYFKRTIKQRFNPHSRVGSDIFINSLNFISYVSIHTPAWGVTAQDKILYN